MSEQDLDGVAADDGVIEDDGVLEPADTLDSDDLLGDVLDTGVDAGEGYRGATRFGTTADEEQRGESLDQLLAEEEPDAGADEAWTDEDDPVDDDDTAAPRAGRLVAPDEGAHADDEKDTVAFDVGIDGAGASAEESAVHVTDDPPFD
jgi:Family of unknown function (DUF5709)